MSKRSGKRAKIVSADREFKTNSKNLKDVMSLRRFLNGLSKREVSVYQ